MTSTTATQNVLLYGVDGGTVILFVAAIPSGEQSKLKAAPATVTCIKKTNHFENRKKN